MHIAKCHETLKRSKDIQLNPWDVTAGLVIVTEAGGKVTDFSGKLWEDPLKYGFETLATNGKIHRGMLARLQKRLKAK